MCVSADDFSYTLGMKKGKQQPFWDWAIDQFNGADSKEQNQTWISLCFVSFAIIALIIVMWFLSCYFQRLRSIRKKDKFDRNLYIQAERALHNISTSVLKKDDLGTIDFFDTCVVCIENCK